jgi:hypothetical protein
MKHKFTSAKAAAADATLVDGPKWNQPHIIVGCSVAANATCTADDDLILASGGVSGITITPLPNAPDGTVLMVMKVDGGPGVVTVLGTINGQANFQLTTRWQVVEIVAQGGAWQVLRGLGTGSVSGAVLLAPGGDQTIVGNYKLKLDGGVLRVAGDGTGSESVFGDDSLVLQRHEWLRTSVDARLTFISCPSSAVAPRHTVRRRCPARPG